MTTSKCVYCHKSGHNVCTCIMKINGRTEKQQHEHYIDTHPLSLFPNLMKEKLLIEKFDEHIFQPAIVSIKYIDYNTTHLDALCYNIGVFRWNGVEPLRKWVEALTKYRTPSTEYGPEHPVLLDRIYPISYWIYLQQETETALTKVDHLMTVARSFETSENCFKKKYDGFLDIQDNIYKTIIFKLRTSANSDTIRTLLEMTCSLEHQLKRISPIIRDQITMTKMVTKTNPDVLPLIISYM